MSTSDVVGLLLAALGGAAVGLERQWSGLALFFGGPRFRAIAGGALALMLVTIGGALLFGVS